MEKLVLAENMEELYMQKDMMAMVKKKIKAMPRNGHCTYMPSTDWILNDTYPSSGEVAVGMGRQMYILDVRDILEN